MLAYFQASIKKNGMKPGTATRTHTHTGTGGKKTRKMVSIDRPYFFARPPALSRLACQFLSACVDNVNKFGLQAGPAHQEPVNVLLRAQFLAVLSGH